MGLDARKHVFWVSDKAIFKPVSSNTETSYKIEISLVASLDKVLSNKQITKVLFSLRRLVSAYVVRKPPKTGFLVSRTISSPLRPLGVMHVLLHIKVMWRSHSIWT